MPRMGGNGGSDTKEQRFDMRLIEVSHAYSVGVRVDARF